MMRRFRKWIGVRHIIVVMMATLILLDIYQIEVLRLFVHESHDYGVSNAFQRLTRAFGEAKMRESEKVNFVCLFVGRIISPILVLGLNNKYFLISITIVEIVSCILLPLLVVKYGFYAFVVLKGAIIFFQSFHWPLAINFVAKWITPQEYTRAVVSIAAGDTLARAIVKRSIALSRFHILATVFVFTIVLKTIWCAVFMIVGAQDPQTSVLIRKQEWELLSKEIGPRKKVHWKGKIPWRGIFTSSRLYALMLPEIGTKWFHVLMADLRSYCPELRMENAELAMIFHPVLAFGTAWLLDHSFTKHYISRNNGRKLIGAIAMWGSALSIALLCYNYEKPNYAAFYVVLAQYFFLLSECSQTTSIFDLSPNYAVVIFCVYMVPAWASLVLRGWMDEKYIGANSSLKRSLPVFIRTGFLLFASNYAFLMIGTIQLLSFDSYDTQDWRKESIITYP